MAKRSGWVEKGVGYIPLTQGKVAIVDPEMVASLQLRNWHAQWIPKMQCFYACSRTSRAEGWKRIYMHREILGLLHRGEIADHISHETLDNRTTNLRRATYSQNSFNRRCRRPKGASFKVGKWEASICAAGKSLYLGRFDTLEKAREAYLNASRSMHGEFSHP